MNETFSMTSLPAYVVNLPERTDRHQHIEREFSGRPEFDLHWVDACRAPRGADGLWQSLLKIIAYADETGESAILFCEDDHQFTPSYDRDRFFAHVAEAARQGAHILLGGIGGFGHWVPVGQNRFWTDWFWCTQFMVVYRSAFRRILEADFGSADVADEFLSRVLPNKMVIFPFISVQRDFGYSDITASNNRPGEIACHFRNAERKGETYQRIVEKYRLY